MSVSRYATVGQATWTAPDGRKVPYLQRRLLPVGLPAAGTIHTVGPGERVDTIAAATLGDGTLSWQLADANLALRPTDLAVTGRKIVIPVPGAVPGA